MAQIRGVGLKFPSPHISHADWDGASRDRTDDLLLAKQALCQLSYGPWSSLRF